MGDDKLLIEFVFKKSFFDKIFRKSVHPIQGKPFNFILKITNIGDNIFSGAKINKIKIEPLPAFPQKISHSSFKEFEVPSLNSGDEKEIFIGRMTTLLHGLVWISCNITPSQSGKIFDIYQKDYGTKKIIDPAKNEWGQELFIASISETSLIRLNRWVVILTALIFWDATFGIKRSFKYIINFIGQIFIVLGSLMIKK